MKITNSTSSELGFRINGMEVFQTLNKRIIFRNKYWGRKLKSDEIVQSMGLFFFNGKYYICALSGFLGCCLRTNAIQSYLAKLDRLKHTIAECKDFRFHSASLLLIYDGYEADR